MDIFDDITRNSGLYLLKFDNKIGKYDGYINTLKYRIINITDPEIINFYDITVLPTIYIYRDKNLLSAIEGFYPKSELINKITEII